MLLAMVSQRTPIGGTGPDVSVTGISFGNLIAPLMDGS